VVLAGLVRQHAPEDPGVERLDPPPEDLRKAGRLFDGGDLDAGLFQVLGRAAGRNDLHTGRGELPRELRDAGLVVDGHEGPPDSRDGGWERNRLRHRQRIL
jgi:hypothetical protein